jgi:hypothetical protein
MVDGVTVPTLYDLDQDIAESKNVAEELPDVVREMEALIERAREDLGDWDTVGKGARFYEDSPRLSAKERLQLKGTGKNRPKGEAVINPAIDNFEPLGSLHFGFESADDPMEGWKVVKGKLAQPVSSSPSLPRFTGKPFNRKGKRHLSTVATANDAGATDNQKAIIESPSLVIKGERVAFLLSGGGPGTRVAFVDLESGEEFLSTTGPAGPRMKRYVLEIPPAFRNKAIKIRLIDEAVANWGHLCFDDFSADGELVR